MFIRRYWEVYDNTKEMNQLQTIITILLILLLKENNTISFKFKQQITGKTGNSGSKDVEIMVPLKYL